MLKLGVNIDHVATLREARYRGSSHGEPDPVMAAQICEDAGAHGITAHLREDRRHILDRDLASLRSSIRTRLNMEMAATPPMVELAIRTKPEIVCLVPENRQEVTTEGGLDVRTHWKTLMEVRERLNHAKIEVSLFINPELVQIEAASLAGVQFIELHTGAFAEAFGNPAQRDLELDRLIKASQTAASLGLKVNAGHGLNYQNVPTLFAVPHLLELNIGHSIISRSIKTGIFAAVREMLEVMKGYPA